MRYLGMTDIREIDRMTFWEYDLKVRAYNLRQIDKERDLHWQAWLSREIQAKKKKGKNGLKYVYGKWADFFDGGKLLEALEKEMDSNEGSKEEKPLTAAQRAMEYARRKRNGEL